MKCDERAVSDSAFPFPPIEPFDTFMLDVGDGHSLYVETSGNPIGRPVVVLHGGPGAGCLPQHRRFFDPDTYRIIIFDQRGAGRSTPSGLVENNTTAHLILDLEQLRQRVGAERWLLFGGSWGSTLAMAYAADHPTRVAGLILRGSWLARSEDISWHMIGLRALAPDQWEDFVAPVATSELPNLLEAYWRLLSSDDPAVVSTAARSWCTFEQHFMQLLPTKNIAERPDRDQVALARIEAHYFRHGCFLDPERLLDGVRRLGNTPGVIVHGRYDWLARLEGAWAIAQAWPTATLEIVADAAHSAFEPGIQARLVAATNRFAQLKAWG